MAAHNGSLSLSLCGVVTCKSRFHLSADTRCERVDYEECQTLKSFFWSTLEKGVASAVRTAPHYGTAGQYLPPNRQYSDWPTLERDTLDKVSVEKHRMNITFPPALVDPEQRQTLEREPLDVVQTY